MNSICNKAEFCEEWKKSIIVPIYMTAHKTDCSNYRVISLLTTTNRILSDNLLSKEIIRDHQCGFRRSRSTTDHIFCIRHVLDKKMGMQKTVHQLFIHFKTDFDLVMREVLFNIPIEFGTPIKLVRLIKMCLNETNTDTG